MKRVNLFEELLIERGKEVSSKELMLSLEKIWSANDKIVNELQQ